ncbi:sugar ABC transporter ATP-binding protein [Phyllobacterium sophorae]|uniref:Sugar ABC transporter ATP-binding protein n=1 Tax=Phyllobacterium sophorae TaxID=1520277 RepID=A0A2P7BFP9_9HYPH|nr:sugar ABC transporter ATP-binding protein [Phyllobacterium sophorae]PSH65242.1 sugar ABC transporter ATP-binding protein [Phyllobacterium sophorae]
MNLALDAVKITKSFGGVHALRGADLKLRRGEIHALLGENGAGKSTMIKVLAGVQRPDSGTVAVDGRQLTSAFDPSDAAAAGLRFVHQDLGLINSLSVAENIAFQTGFTTRGGLIDTSKCMARAAELLGLLGASVHPATLVGALSQADKTIVALARAMHGVARLIVLDEVTASLPTPDVTRIHEVVRAGRNRGTAFLYVTHRLEEVFTLCDRLTVMADGANVATAEVAQTDMGQVVRWITGRSVESGRKPRSSDKVEALGPPRLVAKGLLGNEITVPVSLSLHVGEILGITGVRGSGYERLCRWLAGIEPCPAGEVEMDGQLLEGDPRQARKIGCDTVLGDRNLAAFHELTVRENLFPLGTGNGLQAERVVASRLIEQFGVRPHGAQELAMLALSGGNQQKVIFARSMSREPKVIVLIDPTAGVDIGARSDLHGVIRRAAAAGAAILFGSSDFEEVAEVADRAIIIRKGATPIEIAGRDLNWDRMLHAAQNARITTLTSEETLP